MVWREQGNPRYIILADFTRMWGFYLEGVWLVDNLMEHLGRNETNYFMY